MRHHQVVSHEEWTKARIKLLEKEKEFNRLRDELNEERRQLPWEKVKDNYVFMGADGSETLADLFGKNSQLLIYHFMLGSDWDEGCPSCSFWADNFNGIDIHLNHRDISFLAVSTAPIEKINEYRARMGWSFKWVSCHGNHFNQDYGVSFSPQMEGQLVTYNYRSIKCFSSELPGISVFFKDGSNEIFHTYSTYARGVDMVNGAYHFMDLAPKGRGEAGLSPPMSWVRRRDQYL